MSKSYRSFAKVNLHLQVDGRLPDGYHELRTLFQTVSLHDLVTVEPLAGGAVELAVPDGGAPEGSSNLAHRAAREIVDRWAPEGGLRIELRKRIPAGGGLGGGSSNAATVLLAAVEVLELEVPDRELRALARTLGADVPFFLVGGTALGVARGDEIEPLPDLPEEELLLVDPGIAVSTAEIFGALGAVDRRPLPAAIRAFVEGGEAEGIASLGGFNDLEATVLARVPEVRSVYNALRRAGATCVRLSGSGATVFACFADPRQAGEATSHLPNDARAHNVRTLSRSAWLAARSVKEGEGDWR